MSSEPHEPVRRAARARHRPHPRIALRRKEAAAAIGMSLRLFEQVVQPHLRLIREGASRSCPSPSSNAGLTNPPPTLYRTIPAPLLP